HWYRKAPIAWRIWVLPDRIFPLVTLPAAQFRPNSIKDAVRRGSEHLASLRAQMKEYGRLARFRVGSRKKQDRPAKRTAMFFAGYAVKEIADVESLTRPKPPDEST